MWTSSLCFGLVSKVSVFCYIHPAVSVRNVCLCVCRCVGSAGIHTSSRCTRSNTTFYRSDGTLGHYFVFSTFSIILILMAECCLFLDVLLNFSTACFWGWPGGLHLVVDSLMFCLQSLLFVVNMKSRLPTKRRAFMTCCEVKWFLASLLLHLPASLPVFLLELQKELLLISLMDLCFCWPWVSSIVHELTLNATQLSCNI